jgi:hypothetical protein
VRQCCLGRPQLRCPRALSEWRSQSSGQDEIQTEWEAASRDLRGKFPPGFPAGNPPGREQEVRGDPAGREMLSREYRGEGFNFERNPTGKFMST